MASEPIDRRGRRLRFRLSTALLLVTIAALAVAQFVATRRVQFLEASNKQLATQNAALRAESGYLEVDEPNKVAVVRVRELDTLTWRWKVWLPRGKWKLCGLAKGIPREGVPNGSSVSPIEGNCEHEVSVTIRKAPDGRWQYRALAGGAEMGTYLEESHRLIAPVLDSQQFVARTSDILGDRQQITLDPKQPVVLIRLRAYETVQAPTGLWKSKENPDSSEGIMVWFDRLP
jgi:hypothetical protein